MAGVGLDLLAELRHQRPQMFGLLDGVGSPDRLENRAMCQHAIVVAGEQRQQLELLRREPDLEVVAKQPAPVVVDGQRSRPEDARVGSLR